MLIINIYYFGNYLLGLWGCSLHQILVEDQVGVLVVSIMGENGQWASQVAFEEFVTIDFEG